LVLHTVAEKIIHLPGLYVAHYRFFDRNGPIDARRVDHQMIQARIFGHIRDAVAVTPVLYGVLYRPPADCAMYHQVE